MPAVASSLAFSKEDENRRPVTGLILEPVPNGMRALARWVFAVPGKSAHMVGNNSRAAINVLVVDDEALIRWSLSEVLSSCGHRVIEASSARSALDAIEAAREPIDVVLLDYRLPDSASLDLLATIRQRLPKSAVVLMTAYGALELAQDALSLGAYRVLHKPLDMHDVDSLVQNAYASKH